MKKKQTFHQYLHPALIAITCFFLMIIATISYSNYKRGLWENHIRENLQDILIGKKSRLERSLYSRIYYTRGVAAFVSHKANITNEEFYSLAKEYIKNDSVISTMALSRNGIINALYPLKGHEAAIGLNLLEQPARKDIVKKTIETHQTFLAGPVELVEGGIAFISYTPIFEKQAPGKTVFWGVTDIVLKLESLFNEANIKTTEGKYEFALRGYNGSGNEGAIFWGNPKIFEEDPITISIDLPTGNWVMAGKPVLGWSIYDNQDKALFLILLLCSFVISILIWQMTRALLKIKKNGIDLQAIFGSMDNLIVELNSQGKCLTVAPTNKTILFEQEHKLIGKNVHDLLSHEIATQILDSIQKCLRTKQVVVVEYPLEVNGEKRWLTARINYKDEETVIFNAFDETERIKDEEIIHRSETRLKELNMMKDKFFSILAHDLRNPVGSQKMLAKLILNDYDLLNDTQRKEILLSLKESTYGLYALLEDLLEWSRSQTDQLAIHIQTIHLNEFCNNIVTPFLTNAHLKNIKIDVYIPEDAMVVSDSNVTATILRNLISNAIKFTQKGGLIRISAEEITIDNQPFQKISITDNGVGIQSEKLETIFEFGMQQSTYGTEHEKGSGLGLTLCKDLASKIGAKLSVVSKTGEGSTFSIALPINGEMLEHPAG
ncbi:MAG: ATP-binding protein [Bacteroidales bacterium]|nr:ATP-binding protein [Bacteroidales bacterium]